MSLLTLAVGGCMFVFCKIVFCMIFGIAWQALSCLENWRFRDGIVRMLHGKFCPFRSMEIGVHFYMGLACMVLEDYAAFALL